MKCPKCKKEELNVWIPMEGMALCAIQDNYEVDYTSTGLQDVDPVGEDRWTICCSGDKCNFEVPYADFKDPLKRFTILGDLAKEKVNDL